MPHRLYVLAKEAGFRGLFAGLGPRMIMTAGLVSSQFLMYGAIKEGKSSIKGLITELTEFFFQRLEHPQG